MYHELLDHQPYQRDEAITAQDRIVSINPNSGLVLGSVPVFSTAEVDAAVSRARSAQAEWGARPLKERIALVRRVQEKLVDSIDELAGLCAQETGKSLTDVLVGELTPTLNTVRGYIDIAPRVLRVRRLRPGILHFSSHISVNYEPWGVVALISPFNYPLLLTVPAICGALIAGNAIVQKPSEYTPLTALLVRDLLYQAGVPHDLFQVVTGGPECGRALVSASVQRIMFVGGSNAGREIGRTASNRMVPIALELGGNNAMIVLDDAPLKRAVAAALNYIVLANGQACAAVSRIIVHEAIADEFVEQLRVAMEGLKISPEQTIDADITALVSEEALMRVEQRVVAARAEGVHVLTGGSRLEECAAPLYRPTLLDNVHPEQEIAREETFGPVCSILRVADEEEAVRLANATAYGLTASIWTKDRRRGLRLARRIEAGSVAINDHTAPFYSREAPWGGIKATGTGRVGGEWGLRELAYPKAIAYERLNLPREIYWKPYIPQLVPLFRQILPLVYSRAPRKRLYALARLVGAFVGHRPHKKPVARSTAQQLPQQKSAQRL